MDDVTEQPEVKKSRFNGDALTLPMLCAGIALIACAILIPAADQNRRLSYEREKLKLDLANINTQLAVNDDFLHRVSTDPALAERLAQRQLKLQRAGSAVVRMNEPAVSMSPFHLLNVTQPVVLKPYQPVGGKLAQWCLSSAGQLLVLAVGAGLMLLSILFGRTRQTI